MSSWRVVVNFLLPPPLLLTVLLIVPLPRVVKKGLLIFIRRVLFARVIENVRLVHFALVVSGMALLASTVDTYQMAQQVKDSEAWTPNQRTGLLARKWRGERNFWISVLTFMLWMFLYRFYSLMLEHLEMKDRLKEFERQAKLQQLAGGVAPSAPPMPTQQQSSKAAADRMAKALESEMAAEWAPSRVDKKIS